MFSLGFLKVFIKVKLAKDSVETKTLYMYENEDDSFKNKMKLYL